MANTAMKTSRAAQQWDDLSDFLQCNGRKGPDYLTWVSNFVSTHKRKTFVLSNSPSTTLTIGDLDDTIYKGNEAMLDAWGKFYLPEIVTMKVVGVVEGMSYPWVQLVLMTCGDTRMFVFDGEELHVVASSPKELLNRGLEYPAAKSYYDGEAFKNMTKKDWDEVRKGPVGRSLDQAHQKLVMAKKSRFLENLKSKRHNPGVC